MEAKHTPGPWTQFENGANIGTSDGYAICDMALGYSSLPNEELEANARLIAAAPELLAALRELLTHPDGGTYRNSKNSLAVKAAHAAIAKATAPHAPLGAGAKPFMQT